MIRKILGVDPGLASATAAIFGYSDGSTSPEILDIFDIPTKGDGTSKRIDACAFGNWICRHDPDLCYLENANTMPSIPGKNGERRGMGAASAGRYMRAAGALEATVDMCGVDVVYVQPVVWKRAMGLIGENKGGSLELIRGLYPACADKWFSRQKDHNRAEAALLAIYGGIRTDIVKLAAA